VSISSFELAHGDLMGFIEENAIRARSSIASSYEMSDSSSLNPRRSRATGWGRLSFSLNPTGEGFCGKESCSLSIEVLRAFEGSTRISSDLGF
jgi:hypothetical protein